MKVREFSMVYGGMLATAASAAALKDWVTILAGVITVAYTGQKMFYNWQSHRKKAEKLKR